MNHILLLDDDPDILELLEIFVNENFPDYKTLLATGANSGIRLLNQHDDIDLIISDYEMPEGNGLEIYRYNLKTKIPFIFHSSSLDIHLRDIEFSNSSKLFLIDKPASPLILIDKINEALNGTTKASEFFPIRPLDAVRYSNDMSEIFIKMNKDHFILLSRKEYPNLDLIKKYYHSNSINNFYVRIDDYKIILQRRMSPIEDVKEFSYNLILIHESARHFFSNKEECALIGNKINEIFEELQKTSKYKSLILNILSNGSFTTAHSVLMFYLSYRLLKRINEHTEENLRSYFVSCLFHDLNNEVGTFEHFLQKSSRDSIEQTITSISKLNDVKQLSINLIKKHQQIDENFSALNTFEKCIAAAHMIASISCEQKIYNLKKIKEEYIKTQAPMIYLYLDGMN